MPGTAAAADTYLERLRPPLSWWLLALGFTGSLWLAYQHALGPRVAIPVGAVAGAALAGFLLGLGRTRVSVGPAGLAAGRSTLPLWAVGEVEVLDADGTRVARGPGVDPRTHLLIRGYVPTAVRVAVRDPADAVPAWLVSTRHPDRLATALVQARDRAARR